MSNPFHSNRLILPTLLIAAFLVLVLSIPADAKIYKWVDDKGKTHYTDNVNKIPKKYRNQKGRLKRFKEAPPDPSDSDFGGSSAPQGDFSEHSAVLIPSGGGSFEVEVLLNGKHKVKLVVDTGAAMITLSESVGEKLGVEMDGVNVPKIEFSTAGGSVWAPIFDLNSVRIGDAEVRDVVVNVNPHMKGMEGLLGMNFLSEFKWEMDLNQRKLKLKSPNKPGEKLWDGKNAAWWKKRFREYADAVRQFKGHSLYLFDKKDSKGYEFEKLANFYHELYLKLVRRADKADVPKKLRVKLK